LATPTKRALPKRRALVMAAAVTTQITVVSDISTRLLPRNSR
jgi:hypothetical protein